ncbi:hypothetical protein D0T53_10275 [Dysgonomonas sp. 216]|uniref:FG-GAP-like repeat-containing protein n=1 Tax=Dysgonomonas sp. 216 TaxID=2302934 RepID=UPI0013D6B350|nr:FG-GAP-like repeat-containing protein [Dysgonomonas sp. 216]NDW19297.1 hypothetical protein [Dysgonomonas sp. 216]
MKHKYILLVFFYLVFNIVNSLSVLQGQDFNYPVNPDLSSTATEAVGSLNGELNVSNIGAATYSMPIDVSLGVGGMQPSLAIAYNSQGGNGLVGWGCNLSGLSVISRTPKTIYHDGEAKGITYHADDAYMLDGQRLILVSGTAGQEGAVYSPEADPFTTVTVYGAYNSSTASTWFEVKSSNGMKYRLGTSSSSRQTYSIDGSPRINAWYLSYAEDPLGNYIDYTYTKNNYFVYPNTITYGKNKNGTNSLQNTVTFNYESRNDVMPFVMEGIKGSVSRRLKSITSKTGNETYRIYEFVYNTTGDAGGTKFSRLTDIVIKNSEGQALKPTKLNWEYLPAFSSTSTTIPSVQNNPFHNKPFDDQTFTAMDVNGDGLTDLVGIYQYEGIFSASAYCASLDENGEIRFTYDRSWLLGTSIYCNFQGFSPIDIDGDGINEILVPTLYTDLNAEVVEFVLFNSQRTIPSSFSHAISKGRQMPVYATGDMNNDGKTDVIFIEKEKNTDKYICKITTFSGANFSSHQINLTIPSTPEKMFISDYNGDGLNDMLVFYNGGYTIFWNQGNGISPTTLSDNNKTAGTNIGNVWMIRDGDFNGDGLSDFIMNASYENKWYFALNNGDGTFTKTLACTLEIFDQGTSADNDKFTCLVYDFDFDGKSDVVISKAMYNTTMGTTNVPITIVTTNTHWMRSTGNTLTEIVARTSNKEYHAKASRYVLGDFRGTGQLQLMNYGYDCASSVGDSPTTNKWRLYNNNYDANQGKVVRITDGYGATSEITYTTLANDIVYTKQKDGDSNAQYPVANYQLPIHTVYMVKDKGVTTTYQYGGLKVHLQGKGMLGMFYSKIYNTTHDVATESKTYFDNNFYLPETVYTETTESRIKTGETETYFTAVDKGNKKYFYYPREVTKIDEYNNTVFNSYAYNTDYGYLASESSYIHNQDMYKKVEYGNHVLAGGTYKPRLITTTQKHDDENSVFTQKQYILYNGTYGYPIQVTENYGSSLPFSTYYTYDIFGNVLTTRTNEPLIEYTEYDATKRFVTKTYTVPASEVATFTYDTWGNVLTEKDETSSTNILTTTHTYDNWGNPVSTVYADGRRETFHSGWGINSGSYSSKSYFSVVQGDGKPWVKTWYDSYGREVEIETIGAKNISIKQSKIYNTKNQLVNETSQRGNLTTSMSYAYDTRGRLQRTTSSTGKIETYGYGNRTNTVTSNGRSYTKTYDAWGNIKTSTDPVSTVSYTYASLGKPKTITTGGATLSMTYYDTGNQKTLTDPNAGTTSYIYDAAGRVTQQSRAGKTTTNVYDALGRLTSSVTDGLTTTYTYGTSGNSLLRLSKVQVGSGDKYSYFGYSYDQYGRMLRKIDYLYDKSNGGASSFTSTYTYNDLGQLSNIGYSGGPSVDRQYDAYGNLAKVSVGTQDIWELTNNTGLIKESKMGGIITSTRTLNTKGFLTSQKSVIGSSTLHNMTYTFDGTTGNLTSRTGMIGQTESFTYDNLDRLTTVKHNNSVVMQMDYKANGNIDFKTGLGQYSYLSSKPHALQSVEDDSMIPDTQQEVLYNGFNKVSQIKETPGSSIKKSHSLNIDYGATEQRRRSILKRQNGTTRTVHYAGNTELVQDTRSPSMSARLHYIYAGDGLAAVYVGTAASGKIYYVHKDHLGSIVKLTEGNGTEVFKASYDAWGKQTISNNTFAFHRGYTGHEHLPEFNLIDMNGRVYDPMLSRFLSPDPYVQMPDLSQNFNRYSYCLNNPLKYTDPSGELFWMAIAGPIIFNSLNAGFSAKFEGGNFFKSFAISAVTTAATIGVSQYFGGLNVSGIMPNGALHAGINVTTQGVANVISGNKFFDGWAINAGIGFAQGANAGYQLSKKNGLNYWWGNEVKYRRTQKSFFNINNPLVLKYEYVDMELLETIDCDGMSFGATHSKIMSSEDWQKKLKSYIVIGEDGKEYLDYNQVYRDFGIKHSEIGIDYEKLAKYHKEGYNKGHVRVKEYYSERDGKYLPHRMYLKKVEYVPGKYFKIHVGDPGNADINMKYNLLNDNLPFEFNTFSIFK